MALYIIIVLVIYMIVKKSSLRLISWQVSIAFIYLFWSKSDFAISMLDSNSKTIWHIGLNKPDFFKVLFLELTSEPNFLNYGYCNLCKEVEFGLKKKDLNWPQLNRLSTAITTYRIPRTPVKSSSLSYYLPLKHLYIIPKRLSKPLFPCEAAY